MEQTTVKPNWLSIGLGFAGVFLIVYVASKAWALGQPQPAQPKTTTP